MTRNRFGCESPSIGRSVVGFCCSALAQKHKSCFRDRDCDCYYHCYRVMLRRWIHRWSEEWSRGERTRTTEFSSGVDSSLSCE
ncbi:hypothetical protein Hanom_Chr12g01068681 [Helianthus anomalus]